MTALISMPFRRRFAFSNLEGLTEWDFALPRSQREPGVSAMVRVRDESAKIEHCLRSILPVFDQIVVVDNGSEDGTRAIVRSVMEDADPERKIELFDYPHRLARFGPEHGATPADSVHSAVYFTNWALSHCTHRYVCKWDGDMVLRRDVRDEFIAFSRRIQSEPTRCFVLAGQTIYRDADGDFWLARGEVNREIEIFPNGYRCRFIKHPSWERVRRPVYLRKGEFESVCFYELKFADEDEFSHWSTTEWITDRKKREWENFQRILEGGADGDEGFERLPRSFPDDQVA